MAMRVSSLGGPNPGPLRVLVLEFQPVPRTGWVRAKNPLEGGGGAVEEHGFDSGVVVEILEVPELGGDRTAGMQVQRRGAVGGERQAECLAERRRLQEARDSAAPRGVGLEDIHRAGFE